MQHHILCVYMHSALVFPPFRCILSENVPRITNETAHRAVSFSFYHCFFGRGMPSTRAMPTASATAILKVEMPFASARALSP